MLAAISAAIAFAFAQAQHILRARARRRSAAVAIAAEISLARRGAENLYLNWQEIRPKITEEGFVPLLVVSSDIRLLDRFDIDTLGLPVRVLVEIVSFRNSIFEFYECLESLNSERYLQLERAGREQIVDMTIDVARTVVRTAEVALQSMARDLPARWFSGLEESRSDHWPFVVAPPGMGRRASLEELAEDDNDEG